MNLGAEAQSYFREHCPGVDLVKETRVGDGISGEVCGCDEQACVCALQRWAHRHGWPFPELTVDQRAYVTSHNGESLWTQHRQEATR